MTQNLTYASGNWDIALQLAILHLAIYDLLVISTKYLTVALARLKWRTQNVNYVPINPLTTHDFGSILRGQYCNPKFGLHIDTVFYSGGNKWKQKTCTKTLQRRSTGMATAKNKNKTFYMKIKTFSLCLSRPFKTFWQQVQVQLLSFTSSME